MTSTVIRRGLLSAAGVTAYVTIVATFMFNAKALFGDKPNTVLAPISMLVLLVLSVGVVGTLIFLRPVLTYLDGKKLEAVQLLVATLAWLGLAAVVLFAVQVIR